MNWKEPDDVFMAKKLGSAGASVETLNAQQQKIDPMNRTYSKESLQTQFVNYHNNMANGGVLPASRISASRRQSRTISSSNFENLPIVEGAR